jgi:predicted HicB family RNase H-like nuclease
MFSYKGYHSLVTQDPKGYWRGRVNNIKEDILFEGGNTEELEEAFHQAVDTYLLIKKEPTKWE